MFKEKKIILSVVGIIVGIMNLFLSFLLIVSTNAKSIMDIIGYFFATFFCALTPGEGGGYECMDNYVNSMTKFDFFNNPLGSFFFIINIVIIFTNVVALIYQSVIKKENNVLKKLTNFLPGIVCIETVLTIVLIINVLFIIL